ncbi:MAG: hypothetical protein IKK33_11795 [Lachnospiraceae bacterium]|nr:hypothetical protein [Lachnospiraceae bacterium]
MKKAISVLWTIFIIYIIVLFISVFTAGSAGETWRVFSIVMPIGGISFGGAIVLWALDDWRSRKR